MELIFNLNNDFITCLTIYIHKFLPTHLFIYYLETKNYVLILHLILENT